MVKDLRRIPSVSPNEFDVAAVVAGLDKLRIQLEAMEVKFNLLEGKINAGCHTGVGPSMVGLLPSQLDVIEGKVKAMEAKLADISQSGMAPTMAANATQFSSSSSSSSDETKVLWFTIMSQPPIQIQSIRRKVLGTGNSASILTSASKDKLWHVFLGRQPQKLISPNTWRQVELKCLRCPNSSHKRTGGSRAQRFTCLSSCRRRRTYSTRGYGRLMLSCVTGTSRDMQRHQKTLPLTDRHGYIYTSNNMLI